MDKIFWRQFSIHGWNGLKPCSRRLGSRKIALLVIPVTLGAQSAEDQFKAGRAAYEAKGLYRPSADCIMFTRDRGGFCPVCRRAIGRVVDEYSRP